MILYNMNDIIDKKIKRASIALNKAESAWAKKYWFKVWKDLCLKYKRKIH